MLQRSRPWPHAHRCAGAGALGRYASTAAPDLEITEEDAPPAWLSLLLRRDRTNARCPDRRRREHGRADGFTRMEARVTARRTALHTAKLPRSWLARGLPT